MGLAEGQRAIAKQQSRLQEAKRRCQGPRLILLFQMVGGWRDRCDLIRSITQDKPKFIPFWLGASLGCLYADCLLASNAARPCLGYVPVDSRLQQLVYTSRSKQ